MDKQTENILRFTEGFLWGIAAALSFYLFKRTK